MKIDEAGLKKIIKSDDSVKFFILYGKEVFLVKTYADKIKGKYIADDDDGFNYTKLTGCPDAGNVYDIISTLPVFAEERVIHLNDFDIEKYDSDSMEILLSVLTDLPQSSVVIFSYTGIELEPKKAKTKKFLNAVEKYACITDFDYLSPKAVANLIIKKVNRAGISISSDAAAQIAELTLFDLTLIGNEVEKLCSYVGKGGEITHDVIDLLVSKQLDTGIYELANAITQNKTEKVFGILDDLFNEGHPPVYILSTLSTAFIDYYYVKLGLLSGKNANNIAEDFGYQKNRTWIIGKTMNNVRNTPLGYIKKCIDILGKADYSIKSSAAENKIILEKTLAELVINRC